MAAYGDLSLAADSRTNETTVCGRRFRVTRIETSLRFSPDGPEGPRPSDHDPYSPPAAQMAGNQDTSANPA
ncbi:DUF5954 family protein [Micromonospora sp. DPT]|uniref:DUF5954 family protein n=1 Tax=Micromonospora sp. DPT TaxID=3142975 RepID=UPI00320B9148